MILILRVVDEMCVLSFSFCVCCVVCVCLCVRQKERGRAVRLVCVSAFVRPSVRPCVCVLFNLATARSSRSSGGSRRRRRIELFSPERRP